MTTIANRSNLKYRGLVYGDPSFVNYFRHATPIDVIERMQIGSRPASRNQGTAIEDLRAIPWVFAWTQSRHIIPGWYGFGTGLQTAIEEHGEEIVRTMVSNWNFFKTLFYDVEMVLAKTDMAIANHYTQLAEAETHHFFAAIQQEYELTKKIVLNLRGIDALLDEDPTLQRAIRLRNPYVDPMSLLQVDLLKRWRASNREDDEIFTALLASINGIAHGLQNTG